MIYEFNRVNLKYNPVVAFIPFKKLSIRSLLIAISISQIEN